MPDDPAVRGLAAAGPTLIAVPNVSEGRDAGAIAAIAEAFTQPGVRLLDVHSDPDHHRSVFTLAGTPGTLAPALVAGAREAIARIDLRTPRGVHPHVGAIDVVPIVYVDRGARGAACAEALVVADMIGVQLRVPVLLYGELAGGRTRAQLRRGGIAEITRRMGGDASAFAAPPPTPSATPTGSPPPPGSSSHAGSPPPAGSSPHAGSPPPAGSSPHAGSSPPAGAPPTQATRPAQPRRLAADFGPPLPHVSAGVTLVAARLPLVAFNVVLAPPAGLETARAIAARIREGGEEGLPSVRALGLPLASRADLVQVSLNIDDPGSTPLAAVLAAIARHAAVAHAEIVGLVPRAALAGLPSDLDLGAFDPERHVLERALGR